MKSIKFGIDVVLYASTGEHLERVVSISSHSDWKEKKHLVKKVLNVGDNDVLTLKVPTCKLLKTVSDILGVGFESGTLYLLVGDYFYQVSNVTKDGITLYHAEDIELTTTTLIGSDAMGHEYSIYEKGYKNNRTINCTSVLYNPEFLLYLNEVGKKEETKEGKVVNKDK